MRVIPLRRIRSLLFLGAVLCVTPALAQEAAPAGAGGTGTTPSSYAASLERVVRMEGPEFSAVRYERYRENEVAGIALAALGGAAVIAGGVWALAGMRAGSDLEEGKKNAVLGERWQQGTCTTLFLSGIVLIPIGVPLAVLGRRGVKRQEFLRAKKESIEYFKHGAARVSLFIVPRPDAGKVMLFAEF